jgi:hypothetical protein
MTSEERATLLWHKLNECAAIDKRDAVCTVTAWLEHHGAGYPDVPLFAEKVRGEAAFWADLATPDELASYYLAAAKALKTTPLTAKQTKLMLVECFKKLSTEDKEGFMQWAKTQTTGS